MRKVTSIIAIVFIIAMMFTSVSFADNPVVQTIYTADPAALVYNDTVYLYTGHDEDNSTWFTMNDWRVYSSSDMVNWTDHGSPMSINTFSWAQSDAWAGHCIERNGKFYWYVPVTKKSGGAVIGVAVSDSPTGPFEDALGHPLIEHGWGDIDPAAFIDDDGQAYLYWGNPSLKYVKLNEDMISYDQTVGVVVEPLTEEGFGRRNDPNSDRETLYEEGPWLCKRDGLYYLVYAAGGIPEYIAYSTSTSSTGPWTYRGVIMPTQSIGYGGSFTNHPAVIDFKGHSYFVYHNGALPGGGGFTRSVAIEEFQYNADGTFPTINMTAAGPTAIASLDPYVRNEAETIAWECSIDTSIASTTKAGIETEACSQGGMDVCDIDNGDYIKVKNVDFGDAGAGTFTASVASATKGGTIELHLDSVTGAAIGTLPISYTGGENSWKTETTNISDATGVHDLYFVFKGEATGNLFKVDYWKFDQKSADHDIVAVNASIDKYKIDIVSGVNTANMTVKAIFADGTSEDVTAAAQAIPVQNGIVNISNGIITGTGYGTTNINVSYGGKTDVLTVVVKDLNSELTVKKLTADKSMVAMWTGSTSSFTITAEYFDGHTEDVTNKATYSNPHPDVAEVANGTITAKSVGTNDITASFRGTLGEAVTATISVTVSPLVELIENGGFENGIIAPWIVNDTASISIADQGYNGSAHSLYVTGRTTTGSGPMQSVDGKVKAGKTYKFSAKVKYDEGPAQRQFNLTIRNIDWINMSPADDTSWWVFKDVGHGTITKGVWGTIEGTCTVPADANFSRPAIFIETSWVPSPTSANDLMNFYLDDVSFQDTTAPTIVGVTGVTLNTDTLSLTPGSSGQLTATIAPSTATNKNVTWTSSNNNVATVDSTGRVTAVAAGTTTITATTTDGNYVATCSVTVTGVSTKPFTITSNGQLSRIGGIQATVVVAPAQGVTTHEGLETVLFQLMKDDTPVTIVALERDITFQEEFTAYFNVDPNNTSYEVRVYVLDSFTNDFTTAPESFAQWVTLQ